MIMEEIIIINSNLKPTFRIESGNKPIYLTIYESGISIASIEELDKIDKDNNKAMFSGHFYVRKDGTIYKGRDINIYGDFAETTSGFTFNTNNIGICVEGKFDEEFIGDIQLNSIRKLVNILKYNYNLSLMFYLLELNNDKTSPGPLFPYTEVYKSFVNKNNINSYSPNDKITYWRFGHRELKYNSNQLMNGNDIYYLQGILNKIGYTLNKTSIYDRETKLIIEYLQLDNGLDVTGNIGFNEYKLLRKLYNDFLAKKGFVRIIELTPEIMQGEDIRLLQNNLTVIGYNCPITGYYDNSTKLIVEAFQSSALISIDGRVGPITWNSIIDRIALSLTRNLYFVYPNLYGDDVKKLQSRLIELGYNCEVNGYFDKETDSAIKGYQFNNNLQINGIVDKKLWNLLFNI